VKIYTNVEAVPSRLAALVKLLAAKGPLPAVQLCAFIQPRKDQGMAEKIIDTALEFDVIEPSAKGYDLASGFASLLLDEDDDASLRCALGKALLEPKVKGERNGFAVICAWLLSLDFEHVPDNHAGLKSALEADGLSPDDLQVRSDARWDNVLYWARYLGLIYRLGETMTGMLVPDPTEYLVLNLDQLIKPGETVRASEFNHRLGDRCAVLDGGKLRAMVVQGSSRPFPSNTFSSALSFALERLERRKVLAMSAPDDERSVLHLSGARRRVAFISRKA
jgi:hypothetical protein